MTIKVHQRCTNYNLREIIYETNSEKKDGYIKFFWHDLVSCSTCRYIDLKWMIGALIPATF